MNNSKMVIRATGGPSWLFIFLGISSLCLFVMIVSDLIQRINRLYNFSDIFVLLTLIVLGWFVIFSYKFVVNNKIVLGG